MTSARLVCALFLLASTSAQADHIRNLQEQAVQAKEAKFGHWGWEADKYLLWGSHTNRLIPVYTFGTLGAGRGIELKSYQDAGSPYRSEEAIRRLYGDLPEGTLNPQATYFDQTNIFDLQKQALDAGKKHIILIVFDGMDWQTTWAASIYKNQRVAFTSGRGTGLHFQDYTAGGTSEYGWMVTSPYLDDAEVDVNTQRVVSLDLSLRGGYAHQIGGEFPWSVPADPEYPVGKAKEKKYRQAYTDSASSATSMTTGIKTFNAAINVGPDGKQATTIAELAQQKGYRIGVVTSVPISHATPAAAYSHNVHRDDYQDLSRDLLGLPSVSHPEHPLAGVDLLLGAGYGMERTQDSGQGSNFVPGNAYLTEADLQKVDARQGGRYVVASRQSGANGNEVLKAAAREAASHDHRLLGFFGTKYGHLPFRTADGKYDPVQGRKGTTESYSPADLEENPQLHVMATAALEFLHQDGKPFWLMLEAGDVDWANHDNNIDCSIGAVISGDEAVKAVTDWVEKHSSWQETVLIVTADHGHYLVLEQPELLISPRPGTP